MVSKKIQGWRKEMYEKYIHSSQWRRVALEVKKRDKFLCQDCLQNGIIKQAQHVHHIYPVEWCNSPAQFVEMMFKESNLRCLCEQCHIKAHENLGRKGKKRTQNMAQAQLSDSIRFFFGEVVSETEGASDLSGGVSPGKG